MRYFIYLAYDGTNYHGWQIQPNGDSVQETLMRALSTFLRQEIEVVGAGRTDAGVHARLMIAHFDYDRELDCVHIWVIPCVERRLSNCLLNLFETQCISRIIRLFSIFSTPDI